MAADVSIVENVQRPLKGEDAEVIDTEHCIAVIDGVTSHGEQIEGKSLGAFAASVGREALLEAAQIDCPAEERPRRIVEHLSARLRERLGNRSFQESPTFVFAAFFPEHALVVRVGDCSVLVDAQPLDAMPNQPLRVEEVKKKMRERLAQSGRHTSIEISAMTRAWQHERRNNDEGKAGFYAYGAIDGMSVPRSLIEHCVLPPGDHEVALSTDGVWRPALRSAFEGPEMTAEQMEHMKEDPEVPLSEKAPDDLTYVHFRVHVPSRG